MTKLDSNSINSRVAIIGGGISGLSAAFYLHRLAPERRFVLFESSGRIGGVIETLQIDDSIIELGADNFATLVPDALQLSRDAGLEDALIRPNLDHRLARVVVDGKVHPIPNGFSLMQPTRLDAILKSPVLSWSGKLRMLAEFFVPARRDPSDESLESFARRRLGREAFERLVEPIVGGIFTAKAETLSMQAAMPQFVEMERQYGGLIRGHLAKKRDQSPSSQSARQASGARYDQFYAPKLGMQSWLDQIASKLPPESIQRMTRVESIEQIDFQQWRIKTDGGDKNSETQADDRSVFGAVIVALPANPASILFSSVSPILQNELQSIAYADSAVVAMLVNRNEVDPKLLCFGIVVPQREHRDTLAISFTSEKYPGRTSSDKILLRIFMGGAVRPELMAESDSRLFEKAFHDAQQLIGLRTRPSWCRVIRWPAAMPQYHVGHLDRLARIDTELEAFPNLALAGNAYRGVGIPQCVRSGSQAAERIVAYLGAT
ncbi:MAG: protoporphyrinogen oxidase [Pirellulaceae bacterium]|nr:protoporphyrinogen oxidase [Pirellulaceae bacterium]